MLSVSFI